MTLTKTSFILFMFIFISSILFACKQPELIRTETQTETIQIMEVDPPKHWSVTYKRLEDGEIFNDRGKHCSGYKKDFFIVGAVYKVSVRYDTYRDSDGNDLIRRVTGGCDFFDQPLRPAK